MSDQRKMILLQMDTDDIVNWCMTLESLNADKVVMLDEYRSVLQKLVMYIDRGDWRGNEITDILASARKLMEN